MRRSTSVALRRVEFTMRAMRNPPAIGGPAAIVYALGMSVTIVEERPDSPVAVVLLAELDRHLQQHPYPDESRHAFSIDQLVREDVTFFVVRHEGEPAACGGVKLFGREYGEVKRMYVRPAYRGLGLGKAVLRRLVDYCRGRHVNLLRLETGIYQSEAMGLYERFGFRRRPPFGDYREDPNSIYYEMGIDPPEEPNEP